MILLLALFGKYKNYENTFMIKYAHKRTTEGHEGYRRKIHCLIMEVKVESCPHDSE